jgi:hypothetical protein
VVTTNQNNPADAANCTPQAASGTGPDAACTLADALAYASNAGSGTIRFSSTVFNASNTAAENTISVPNNQSTFFSPEAFVIPANTTITGPTTVIGSVATNLITIVGQIPTITVNGTVIFQVNSGASGIAISNLNLTGGEGAIFNDDGSMTVTNCVITKNNSVGNGGGINNLGTMIVKDSSIIANSSTYYFSQYGPFDGGVGGGIFNSGTLTVLDSTISGNTDAYANASGGGIYNSGTLTVINSTIAGNTSVSADLSEQPPIGVVLTGTGGGIANAPNGTLTVINSTISGNDMRIKAETGVTAGPGSGGGGISGVSTLENTIVSGNTASVGSNDYEGNYTDYGGNLVGEADIQLASLGDYGGLTQTMIPLPGSPAICYGALSNVKEARLNTDQRGLPRKTYYKGIHAACVDAGAVETNYALNFTTQPPARATIDVAMKPAPVVELTESGVLFTDYGGEIALVDSHHVLNAPTLATLLNGSATFSDAIITAPVTKDTLTAVLGLASTPEVPTLNLVTNASVKVTVPAVPAVLISPAPGSTLTSGTVTFTWTASDVPGTQYALQIGTEGQGTHNIYVSPTLTATSVTVKVPTTGGKLYVALSQGTIGPWQYTPYTYMEARGQRDR